MARGEKSDRGRRSASRKKSEKPKTGAERSRGRSGRRAAAGAKSSQAEAKRKSARRRSASARGDRSDATGTVVRLEEAIDLADDAAPGGFLPADLDEEMEGGERESLERPPSEFGAGQGRRREELQTDGPVMGGPGMLRMGGDRAVSSGTGGLAAGEDLDPVAEGDYWRENFRRSPYSAAETEQRYEPAYRFGWNRAGQYEYRNRGFEEVEMDLRREWEGSEETDQPWEDARDAAREAWERARETE
jgi:hypothetical protein